MVKKNSLTRALGDANYLPFKHASKEIESEPRYTTRVFSITEPAPFTLVLIINRPHDFHFQPGQYLWLVLPKRSAQYGKIDRRAYSIASRVLDYSVLEIVIRLTGSEYLQAVRDLKKDDEVEIIGPFGSAFVSPEEGVIMISGGIGISPFLSITRSKLPGMFSLYAFESADRPLYCREELRLWGESAENNEAFLLFGIPKKEDFPLFLKKNDDRPIFISGPQGFVTAIALLLKQINVKSDRLRYESTYPETEGAGEIERIFSSIDDSGSVIKGIDILNQPKPSPLVSRLTIWRQVIRHIFTRGILPIIIILIALSGVGAYIQQQHISWAHIFVIISFFILGVGRLFFYQYKERTGVAIVILIFGALLLIRVDAFFMNTALLGILIFPFITRLFLSPGKSLFFDILYAIILILIELGVYQGVFSIQPLPDPIEYLLLLIFIGFITQLLSRIEGGYARNIETKAKEQETLLRDLQKSLRLSEMFTLISEQTSNHVVVTDHLGRIMYANKAAENLTGYSFKEMRGQTPRLWGGLMTNDFYRSFWTRKSQGKVISHELINRHKNGKLYTALGRITPLIQEGGIIAYVATEEDISCLKDLDKAKTEFVSLASHQLRTPLTAISWYSEMLLAGDAGTVTADQREYLEEISRGNKRMTELVNALLNASRLELGTFTIDPVLIDVTKVGREVMAEMAPYANQKKIRITANFSENIPSFLADEKLLYMIYQNLLTNAVKYTPESGDIQFSLSVDEKEDAIVCQIKDSGWGIPINQQEKIFTKLFRADNIKDKDADGTGLGLYIVKSVVEQAGGKIWFESVENKGTTFFVSFPTLGMKKQTGGRLPDNAGREL